jgi:hypothetical protein
MADFDKHRRESLDVAVGFSSLLDDGDGLASIDDVVITKHGAPDTDVSSQFGSPSGTINGTDVELSLGAASGSGQQEGLYKLLVEVTTSGGDTLVAQDSRGRLPTVKVSDEGDPDA